MTDSQLQLETQRQILPQKAHAITLGPNTKPLSIALANESAVSSSEPKSLTVVIPACFEQYNFLKLIYLSFSLFFY